MKFIRHGKFFLLLVLFSGIVAAAFFSRPIVFPAVESGFRAFSGNLLVLLKSDEVYSENMRLRKENRNLRAQLQSIHIVEKENESLRAQLLLAQDSSARYHHARVMRGTYSNVAHALGIMFGSRDGAVAGMPVLWDTHIYLGEITRVHASYSVVRTIFDASLKMPVQIGEDAVPALLVGGAVVRLESIPKDADIRRGDPVLTGVGHGSVPPDLYIGEVLEVEDVDSGVFKRATVRAPYRLYEIWDALVITESR